VWRSSSLRLAALYTAMFALSLAGLGAVTLLATRSALSREFDGRIQAEATALAREYQTEGLNGVVQAVRERDSTPGALDYGFESAAGEAIAGRLAGSHAPLGWSTLRTREPGEDVEALRVFATALPDGSRLLVADEIERMSRVNDVVLHGFAAAFAGVLVIGTVGGLALSRGVHRRLADISGTAEAIIDGDLSRRVPVRGSGDDLDRLAATINRMLDRISALMESLRQVSNDIAHDLRTPLTRLRQRLELDLRDGDPRSVANLEPALQDLDAILETFAALLRIAQIEGGARRAGFQPVDLAAIAATVCEAFAPSAEEGGRTLELESEGPAETVGDRELLTQALANLVENGLIHTPPGARLRIVARRLADGGATVSVIDDGPGVPAAERGRVFDRFYRLERSRSTPGSGLGLALVAAVAKLHEARLELLDGQPGLEARLSFPAASATLGFRNPPDIAR
jgi:signal transduction histidine kinase